jgi:hypothetical protein
MAKTPRMITGRLRKWLPVPAGLCAVAVLAACSTVPSSPTHSAARPQTSSPTHPAVSSKTTSPAQTSSPSQTSSPTQTSSPSQTSSPVVAAGTSCTTNSSKGTCGPYAYPQIEGAVANPWVANNVWSPIPGWQQTLNAKSPGDWQVTANLAAGNTAVVSMPGTSANYGLTTGPAPLPPKIVSSFAEYGPGAGSKNQNSYEFAYDVWLGTISNSKWWVNEMMIQQDNYSTGKCPNGWTASGVQFGGSNGVRVQSWYFCKSGSELIWQLAPQGGERSGSVDILAMINWLISHGYLPQDTGLTQIDYGVELRSTGGVEENFGLSNFSITTTSN